MEATRANSTSTEMTDDEVLVAFATTPGANLADWMRQYPAQARDLARLAADHWSSATSVPLDRVGSAPVTVELEKLRTIGRETVRACRVKASPAAPAVAPITGLVAAARARGLDPQTLAERVSVPYALLFKLHRRLIAPDSLPKTLVRDLAEAIGRTRDEVAAYLRQPPTLAAGASYRADDTPQTGAQESFTDALNADPETTDAHRARWSSEA